MSSYNAAYTVLRALTNLHHLKQHELALFEFEGKNVVRRPSEALLAKVKRAQSNARVMVLDALLHQVELDTFDEISDLHKGMPEQAAREKAAPTKATRKPRNRKLARRVY